MLISQVVYLRIDKSTKIKKATNDIHTLRRLKPGYNWYNAFDAAIQQACTLEMLFPLLQIHCDISLQ